MYNVYSDAPRWKKVWKCKSQKRETQAFNTFAYCVKTYCLIFPGKRTLSVALNDKFSRQFVFGPVYMRPGRSQGGAEIEICGMFTWGRYKITNCNINNEYPKFTLPACHYLFATFVFVPCSESETGLKSVKCICVYNHTALILSRSEDIQFGQATEMTSGQCELFSFRSHVNIDYKYF